MTDHRKNPLSFEGTIGPWPYLGIGLALSVLKYGLDVLVAGFVLGRPWSPRAYAFSEVVGGLFALGRGDQVFYLTMLALALPFLSVGLALTVRRLRDAGWPLWVAAFFFAPMPINILFFLVLGLTPGRARPIHGTLADTSDVPGAAKAPPTGPAYGRAAAALLIPLPFAGASLFVATTIFRDYGWSVFVGLPFVLPMLSVILYGYGRRPTRAQCLNLGLVWILVATACLIVTAFEGLICILMALPIVLPVMMLGVLLGYYVVTLSTRGPRDLGRVITLLLAALPAMIGAEHATCPEPPLFACRTSVVVDAPPATVWRHVLSFPELAPPRDLIFRAGVAYPVRARIDGRGAGSVRRCEFSTGAFVEPIEVWDEPKLLRFAVTSNPPPMREWNPFFEIHPPHLQGFLVSERGQFHLAPLPGGRTRLQGTTWYRHGLWPAAYWRLWSDPILHLIHRRVLGHIKGLAERDPAAG